MAEFHYVAATLNGGYSNTSGTVTAENKTEAEKKIRAKYNYPVRIYWGDEVSDHRLTPPFAVEELPPGDYPPPSRDR